MYPYLFPYPGMKGQQSRFLFEFFPEHKRFVDVCAGSGAAIIQNPHKPAERVFNDLDPQVANVPSVLQNPKQLKELCQRVARTDYDPDVFAHALTQQWAEDPVTQAWAFLVAQWQAARPQVHATKMRPCGWGKSAHAHIRNRWQKLPTQLMQLANVFAGVKVHRLDCREVISKYASEDTLFFLDLPYYPPTGVGRYNGGSVYQHELTEKEHRDMLWFLLQHNHAKIMIVGPPHAHYQEYLGTWHRTNLDYHATQKGEDDNICIWMNYDHPRLHLPGYKAA